MGRAPAPLKALASDYEVCRELHRKHGTTYYFATSFFPAPMRRKVHAIYGFVRAADEIVDNPTHPANPQSELAEFRATWRKAWAGEPVEHPVLRAFAETARESFPGPEEPEIFLDAMEADLTVTRYANYDQLRGYMRGSAAAVGLMMCHAIGAPQKPEVEAGAIALAEAMQLTNFLRDVGEDWGRGRIYLPLDEMAEYGLGQETIRTQRVTPAFREFMKSQVCRARCLYHRADTSIPMLPVFAQKPVRVARVLYSRILDRIEERDYDVFSGRARTTKIEKILVAGRVVLSA